MNDKLEALVEGSEVVGGFRVEYDAFGSTCALCMRLDRAAVRVAGERRAEMLNGLVSNRVTDLVDVGRAALLLSAKGRVLTDMRVLPRPDDLLLDLPSAGLENVRAVLKKYLPPIYATHEDLSDRLRQIGIYGPAAVSTVHDVLGGAPADAHLAVARLEKDGAELLLVRNRCLAGDGVELWAPVDAARALTGELLRAVEARGGCAAGTRAVEVQRVEWGVPRYGSDVTEENLAQETGLEDAISYDKGCYLGQEVVARVHYRGHVNRRLMGLRLGSDPAAPGVDLSDGGKTVGSVTSSVTSPTYGAIGLGYVRREVEVGARLDRSDGAGVAEVTALPFRRSAV